MQTPLLSSKWLLPAMVSGILFVSCSHKLAPEGHYQTSPMVTDGKTDDWPMPLRFSNASYTLQYNVTNDDKNLYICVSSRETATQLRILRSGMTIWFDPKGEKNKTVGLYFPIRKQPDPGQYRGRGNGSANGGDYATGRGNGNMGGSATGIDVNTREAELLLQSNYYNTTGFPAIENGQFGVTDAKGPVQLAIKHDDQDSLLVYEIMIPIRNVLGADWKAKAGKKNFSVGIVLNATPAMGGGGGGGRPNGGGMRGMGGGMGGMRVGLGGGRRYGGGGSGSSQGQKEESDWYVFRLASK
jgi:hypothetical protein